MKKFNILLLAGAATMGFTACDDAPADALPQTNPQPAIITAADIDLTPATALAGGNLELPQLTNDLQDSVAVLQVNRLENLPEGYSLVPVLELAADEDFANVGKVSCRVADGTAYAAIADINAAYAAIFGYNNAAMKVYSRVQATTVYDAPDGEAVAIVGGSNTYYAASSFTLTPDLMVRLYVPMSNTDFDISKAQALQTNDGVNYWGYVNVTGSFYFSNGRDGKLQRRWDSGGEVLAGEPIAVRIDGSGCYWISYNITSAKLDNTAITTYGVIGDLPDNNWSSSVALTQLASNPLIWNGKVTFGTGEWKFRANDGWDINLGGSYTNLEPGGDNLPSPGAGEHTVTLDLSTIPYTVTIL